ncbi:MAG: MAPEG family protein [Polyangiaceae bacterium]
MVNILATVPISLLWVYLTKSLAIRGIIKQTGKYDNDNPRDQQAALEGPAKRAIAAHYNGFEAFPGFAIGVVLAKVTGTRPDIAMILAWVHVAARIVYPFLYINQISSLRSTVWAVGFLATMGLLCLPVFG